jgi:hypothetical protein
MEPHVLVGGVSARLMDWMPALTHCQGHPPVRVVARAFKRLPGRDCRRSNREPAVFRPGWRRSWRIRSLGAQN